MFVLERLWKGNVRPCERSFKEGSQYAELMHTSTKLEDAFYDELSVAGKKVYKEHYEMQMRMMDIAEQDAYIQGVRFGARFVLDVIGEYHSPMPQIQDSTDSET